LPKLTHKLKDFAEIRFGIKTGANEFFYMKDVTHLYEADYLSNPEKFHEWGVKAKTAEQLKQQGLIYIENEGGYRCVIDSKDILPVVRTPEEIGAYKMPPLSTYVLYTTSPGKYTIKYIKAHEKQFSMRKSFSKRKVWYRLPKPVSSRIILIKSFNDVIYQPLSERPLVTDQRGYTLQTDLDYEEIWKYLVSTVFFLTIELFCDRLGGGASDIRVEDYQEMPVPNLKQIRIDFDARRLLSRQPYRFDLEVKQRDRYELDKAVLTALGFKEWEVDNLVSELHRAFVEVVEDRLIKAGRPLR
ncbi:MAG: hypothetical protein NZ941_06550, partial [Candidatus Caldarchaeum sp.]|nr:hypothetical protein [Candidatus Caldarchaeum sp.]